MIRILKLLEFAPVLYRTAGIINQHAGSAGSISVRADRPRRVDEPTPTAEDRLSSRGERVLREQLGGRRLRLNDDQRRRLAAEAKGLGRKLLAEVATIVTPETLLARHRRLIA
jgi:hypothetical protein